MKKYLFIFILWIWISLFLSAFSSAAFGIISTTTLDIGASIPNSCSTVTATAMAFGNYNPASGIATTQTSTINVTCTLLTPFTVALNIGTTTGASFSNRLMANGAYTLGYNLYTDLLHTTIWGDGTSGTSTESGTGLGVSPTSLLVYGQIPAGQNSAVGGYSDTITATVTF